MNNNQPPQNDPVIDLLDYLPNNRRNPQGPPNPNPNPQNDPNGRGMNLYDFLSSNPRGPPNPPNPVQRQPRPQPAPNPQPIANPQPAPNPQPVANPQPAPNPNQPRTPLRAMDAVFGREISIRTADVPLLGPLFRRPRKQKIVNLSGTMSGPPSPGPSHTLFDVSMAPAREIRARLPENDPRYISLGQYHPNEEGIPALQSVRSLGHSITTARPGTCFEEKTEWSRRECRALTNNVCVDLNHGLPTYICNRCHGESRRVVGQAVIAIAKSLRAYYCHQCASLADHHMFQNMRFNIWGLPADAFDGFARDMFISVSRGPPEPITGCMCATKLIDHNLCTPHRAFHFLDVRKRADEMRDFVEVTFGRMVCPMCLTRPSADANNFLDQQGNPCTRIVYSCMACLGVVIADPATHASIDDLAHVV